MRELLQCESSANLYVSYGSLSGFGYHKDDHHVLVKQLVGKKRWQFGGVANDIVLNPGDLLFVPKGISHNPISESQKSFHVTYSIVKPNLFDFIKWAGSKEFIDHLKNYSLDDKNSCRQEIDSLFNKFLDHKIKENNLYRGYSMIRMFP